MAVTLQSFVADPTLTTGDARLATPVADPTLVTGNARFGAFVADGTLSISARLALPQIPPLGVLQSITAVSAGAQQGSTQSLQKITASSYGAAFSSSTVQAITGSGTAPLESYRISLQAITGSGTARFEAQNGSSAGTLEYLTAQSYSVVNGVSSAELGRIVAAARGHSGAVGSATLTLPFLVASSSGFLPATGTSTVRIPLILARGAGQAAIGNTFSTVALHTESLALTTYTNYPFNSFAKFNGVWLGASSTGIFALAGATDAGTFIDAAMRTGITDFGSSHIKRVDRCYIGYRTDGNMILRVFTEELTSRDYLLTSTGAAGLHGNHVRIGKGLEARYWQFEIANKDGSDFELDMMEFKPTKLRRRIGGGNA